MKNMRKLLAIGSIARLIVVLGLIRVVVPQVAFAQSAAQTCAFLCGNFGWSYNDQWGCQSGDLLFDEYWFPDECTTGHDSVFRSAAWQTLPWPPTATVP